MSPAASFRHQDAGTPVSAWAGLDPSTLPVLPLHRFDHLLVVAAHPDDETLGAGGLIHRFAADGGSVTVLVATDGEHSHPNSPTHDPARLASLRQREIAEAVALLAPSARVVRLGLPDGQLGGHRSLLADRLDRLVRPGTLLVAPWVLDRHPDHEAAALATAQVAARRGLESRYYPIWGWHWGRPEDPEFDRTLMSRVPLAAASRTSKALALSRYRSQVLPLSPAPGDEPVLTSSFLAHFDQQDEIFLSAPHPPGPRTLDQAWFDDFYRRDADPWGFTDRWYEERKRAVLLASLPRRRFRSAFEPGCSIGVLTAALARRCDALLATDISSAPLGQARERVAEFDHVTVEQRRLPDDWPDRTFDLVVVSEVGYYLDEPDLRRFAGHLQDGLDPDGVVVLCHWRHPVDGYPLSGDRTHEILMDALDLRARISHLEPDFRLDVLVGPAVPDVAEAEGLR